MTFSLKKILSVIVSNEAGVLTRVATVFSSRGFNIETMTIGSTQNPELSKIIIVLPDETVSVDQVMKQLNKLVQVLDVQDLSQFSCIERELMLIKLSSSISNRSRILEIVEIFKAEVVDISEDTITIEISGDFIKIYAFEELIKPYKIIEVVRSGLISLSRDFQPQNSYIPNVKLGTEGLEPSRPGLVNRF